MKIALSILFLLCCFLGISQEEQYKFDYSIESSSFGDQREISIYLPKSFYRDSETKFTVTYVLDGHFDPFIDLVAKTIEYNSYMNKYTPTIVVGIHAKQRGWEFSMPTKGEDDDYEGGRAPELQDHLGKEVFPLVDSIFGNRILSFRTILGHSSGGTFVLSTLFGENTDLFDAYIGISPALRPGENTILEDAATRLNKDEKLRKFLYCSTGTVAEREEIFSDGLRRLDSIFTQYPDHGIFWRQNKFEGMGHWTCVPPSVNDAMVELTRAFRVDEKTLFDFSKNEGVSMRNQIESFYETVKEQYGFIDIPTSGYLNNVAWELAKKGKLQAALEIYDWAMVQYPTSFKMAKQKAKVQFFYGDRLIAKQFFLESLIKLETIKESIEQEEYEEQKEYVNKKITEIDKN